MTDKDHKDMTDTEFAIDAIDSRIDQVEEDQGEMHAARREEIRAVRERVAQLEREAEGLRRENAKIKQRITALEEEEEVSES